MLQKISRDTRRFGREQSHGKGGGYRGGKKEKESNARRVDVYGEKRATNPQSQRRKRTSRSERGAQDEKKGGVKWDEKPKRWSEERGRPLQRREKKEKKKYRGTTCSKETKILLLQEGKVPRARKGTK